MNVIDWISELLELGERWPGYRAMALRSVVVFVVVLAIVRIGSRRFISKLNAFDMLVAIMIGSIASRAITGNSTFGPALLCIAALVALHWLFAFTCYHTSSFGRWLKGSPRQIIADGKLQKDQMSRSNITRHDIEEAMRSRGLADRSEIENAWLERDGSISIVTKDEKQYSSAE